MARRFKSLYGSLSPLTLPSLLAPSYPFLTRLSTPISPFLTCSSAPACHARHPCDTCWTKPNLLVGPQSPSPDHRLPRSLASHLPRSPIPRLSTTRLPRPPTSHLPRSQNSHLPRSLAFRLPHSPTLHLAHKLLPSPCLPRLVSLPAPAYHLPMAHCPTKQLHAILPQQLCHCLALGNHLVSLLRARRLPSYGPTNDLISLAQPHLACPTSLSLLVHHLAHLVLTPPRLPHSSIACHSPSPLTLYPLSWLTCHASLVWHTPHLAPPPLSTTPYFAHPTLASLAPLVPLFSHPQPTSLARQNRLRSPPCLIAPRSPALSGPIAFHLPYLVCCAPASPMPPFSPSPPRLPYLASLDLALPTSFSQLYAPPLCTSPALPRSPSPHHSRPTSM